MAWQVPPSFSNGPLTAAQMNILSDDLSYLKGVAALLTDGTDADSGTTMFLRIKRTSQTGIAFASKVGSEANDRFQIESGGALRWGIGGASATDTLLQRTGTGELEMLGTIRVNRIEAVGVTDAVNLANGYIEISERSDPAAAGNNALRLFARDNGAGKTQLAVRFSSGQAVAIATQA